MIDKEFMVYRIGVSNKIRPNGINYRTEAEAKDAAKRFAEKEHCIYYVFEVCEVVNTLAEVSEYGSLAFSKRVILEADKEEDKEKPNMMQQTMGFLKNLYLQNKDEIDRTAKEFYSKRNELTCIDLLEENKVIDREEGNE